MLLRGGRRGCGLQVVSIVLDGILMIGISMREFLQAGLRNG